MIRSGGLLVRIFCRCMSLSRCLRTSEMSKKIKTLHGDTRFPKNEERA